jgi:sialic acid synthase SpsE
MYLIGDPGSTHCGDFESAESMIRGAKDAGIDAIKFQLFPMSMTGDNVYTPYRWMQRLVDIGKEVNTEVFASVFDVNAIETLDNCRCESVKLAYSRNSDELLLRAIAKSSIKMVYVSGDAMTDWEKISKYLNPDQYLIPMFCIPRYPVYEILDYRGIEATGLFDGFSDHTIGCATLSTYRGSLFKYWEKHIRPESPIYPTPDSRFAVTLSNVKEALQ